MSCHVETIFERLKKAFGESVLELQTEGQKPWILVKAEHLLGITQFLRDDPDLRFDFLRNLSAVDYHEEFELVYLLFSYSQRHEVTIKVRLPREEAKVASVEEIWPAAGWYEREAFDLMGIEFEGNHDLRRLFMPDDWEGHPLRKDYREKGEYHGVSTTREYETGMPVLPTLAPSPKEER